MSAIYCGNFGFETRRSDLQSLFSQYGKVVRLDKKSGYAFVYFEDEHDAEDAICGLNGHIPSEPEYHGCRLIVEWGKGERGGSGSNPIPNKTLFVANFDFIRTKDHDIKKHFEPYGKVLSVSMHQDYAFVHFETQENATKALQHTHRSKLFGRLIRVEYALIWDDDEKGNRYGRRKGDSRRSRNDASFRSPSPAYRSSRPSPVCAKYGGPSNLRDRILDRARASPVNDRWSFKSKGQDSKPSASKPCL